METSDLPLYKQKVDRDRINVLNNLLQSKSNQLSKRMFSFEGNPVPINGNAKIDTAYLQPVLSTKNTIEDIKNVVYTINTSGHTLIDTINHSYFSTENIPSSLHLKNGNNSIFNLVVHGPIFIHDIDKCILVLEGHQVRLHNVRNTLVLVKSVENNRIVIENCDQLIINQGIEVDDFDFPTKELKNPHFQYVDNIDMDMVLNTISSIDDLSVIDDLFIKVADRGLVRR